MSATSRSGASSLLTGTFLFVFGSIGLVAIVSDLRTDHRIAHWPTINGEVVAARLIEYPTARHGFEPQITFRYQVNGREYQADQIHRRGWSFTNRDFANHVVRAHPPGRSVTVWYDPDDPAKAYLNVEQTMFMYLFVALAFVLCVAGTYLTIVGTASLLKHLQLVSPNAAVSK